MKLRRGFTIIELLVVMSIILLLASLLIPSLVEAQNRARYVKWQAYSRFLQSEPALRTYYEFDHQSGDEIGKTGGGCPPAGCLEVKNSAVGDPFAAATEKFDKWNNNGLGFIPTRTDSTGTSGWTTRKARWFGKSGLMFDSTDGTDDYVALHQFYGANEAGEFTIAAWVNIENNGVIGSFDHDQGAAELRLGGKVQWHTNAEGSAPDQQDSYLGSGNVKDGQWHLLAGTYSAEANEKRIWIDGHEQSDSTTVADVHLVGGKPAALGTSSVRYGFLGARSNATRFNDPVPTGNFMKGAMDEFMVFHRALDTDEMINMFRAGVPTRRE
jgi:prepilin-type N-terminal cleavage/methylation domain-containing protein